MLSLGCSPRCARAGWPSRKLAPGVQYPDGQEPAAGSVPGPTPTVASFVDPTVSINGPAYVKIGQNSLAPASWCTGSAIKRLCEPVPVTHAPGGHRPDAKRRVHRSAAQLPARPRPAPLVATNSSPGVCSVPTPPSRCISPPVCWRFITPPVAVAGSWGCTLAASPGTR